MCYFVLFLSILSEYFWSWAPAEVRHADFLMWQTYSDARFQSFFSNSSLGRQQDLISCDQDMVIIPMHSFTRNTVAIFLDWGFCSIYKIFLHIFIYKHWLAEFWLWVTFGDWTDFSRIQLHCLAITLSIEHIFIYIYTYISEPSLPRRTKSTFRWMKRRNWLHCSFLLLYYTPQTHTSR